MAKSPWVLPDGFDESVKKALRQLFAALKNAKRAIPPEALEQLRMGNWQAFQSMMDWRGIESAFEPFKELLSAAANQSAVKFYQDGGVGAQITFDLIDARAVRWASERAAELVTEITEAMRLNIRNTITSSTMGDMTWREAAEEIYRVLPLTEKDANAVKNYHTRQFETFVRKGMTEAAAKVRAKTNANAYAEKLARRRAETISRTELASAASEGRYLGWQAGMETGMVDGASLKEWVAEPDACEKCHEMDGKLVPWNEPFLFGKMMPPQHPNCRCAGVLLPPDYADTVFTNQAFSKSGANQFEVEFAKHMAGKHDQSTHGHGSSQNNANSQSKRTKTFTPSQTRSFLEKLDYGNLEGDAKYRFAMQKLAEATGRTGKPTVINFTGDEQNVSYRSFAGNHAYDFREIESGRALGSAEEKIDMFLHGDTPYIASGGVGLGLYVSPSLEQHNVWVEEERNDNWQGGNQHTLKLALAPDAKILDTSYATDGREHFMALSQQAMHMQIQSQVFDRGRWSSLPQVASLMLFAEGYDAILGSQLESVFLNPSKILVDANSLPVGVTKHMAGLHDQSTHGRKSGLHDDTAIREFWKTGKSIADLKSVVVEKIYTRMKSYGVTDLEMSLAIYHKNFAANNPSDDETWAQDQWFLNNFGKKAPDIQALGAQEFVNTAVHQWAASSNDTQAMSLMMQDTAKEVFNLQATASWKIDANTAKEVEWMKRDQKVYTAFIQAQYDETQALFKEKGIKEVTLYRGMVRTGTTDNVFDAMPDPTDLQFITRPLSSWSGDKNTAITFGGVKGFVSKAVMPVEKIFSTPMTGTGCYNEQEFVTLGGIEKVIATDVANVSSLENLANK